MIAAPLDTNCRTFQNCYLLPETVVFSPSILHDDNSFDIWSTQSHLVAGTDEMDLQMDLLRDTEAQTISSFCSCSAQVLSIVTLKHI